MKPNRNTIFLTMLATLLSSCVTSTTTSVRNLDGTPYIPPAPPKTVPAMTLYTPSAPASTLTDLYTVSFSQTTVASKPLDINVFSSYPKLPDNPQLTPVAAGTSDFSNTFIMFGDTDKLKIDQSQTGRGNINLAGISLKNNANQFVVMGSTQATSTNVGLLSVLDGTVFVQNNGNLQIDSGLLNSSVITQDSSSVSFGKYSAGNSNPLISQNLTIGSEGLIDTTESSKNSLMIPQGQTVTLSGVLSSGGFGSFYVDGVSMIPSGMIKTGTLTNKGKLVLRNGSIQGNIVNNGNFEFGDQSFNFFSRFGSVTRSTITGDFSSTGSGNSVTLITGNQLNIGGNVTLDSNTKITVKLNNGGKTLSEQEINTLTNFVENISTNNITNILNTLPPLLNITGAANLSGNFEVSSLTRIKRGTVFGFLKASSINGNCTFNNDWQVLPGITAINDLKKVMLLYPGAIPGTSNFYILVTQDIPASLNSYVAPLNTVFSHTSSFSNLNFSGNQFMNQFTSGVSFDMNATKTQVGALSVTTSADESAKSNFVGMSFKVYEKASFGAYASYKADALNEFGAFHLMDFQGFDVLSSVIYGAKFDQKSDQSVHLSSDSKTLILQTKISKSFKTDGLTLTPHMALGMGQLIHDRSKLQIEGVDMDMTRAQSAAYSGLGLDINSKFKIDRTLFTAFASLDFTTEFGNSGVTVEGTKIQASSAFSSLMLGVKVEVDRDSSVYATAQFSNQDNKFTFGATFNF